MTRARDLASGINGVRPFAMAAGVNALTSVTAITLPAGRFTQAPLVTATAVFGGASSGSYYANVLSTSTTSISLYVVRNDGTLINGDVQWHAIQMTSGASIG
jgi:hypothetical protein